MVVWALGADLRLDGHSLVPSAWGGYCTGRWQITAYGLVKTFLAGSGAPVWTGAAPDDHVVRLRVPAGIDTLNVSLGRDEMDAALNAARQETRAGLRQLDASMRSTPTSSP